MPRGPTYVVVGAALAGGTAAATLREEGFDGRLIVLGDEPELPYQRPPLSKAYLRGEVGRDDLVVRPDGWWLQHDVETRPGAVVRALDPDADVLLLSDGERVAFDRCVIATGVRNRALPVPGYELEGVFQLRTVADADAIRSAASGAGRAVVVGMGFIGAEVTASLRALGLDVTVVEVFETTLLKVLGPRIGRAMEAIHRDHGVTMLFGDKVDRFEGAGRVERVVTSGGRTIDCDLVVVGVGTEPVTDAVGALAISDDGGVEVGPTLETARPGVFAAGDVASHAHPIFGRVRVEHFDNAIKMGAHAARAMLGAGDLFDDPHWFWSDQYEHQIQMAGVSATGEMVLRGSIEERSFCAFFLDERGVLRAAVSLDRPHDVRRSLSLIRAEARPDPAVLADPGADLRAIGR